MPESRRVRMRVIESFRGDVGESVDVFTGSGGGDCGYDFQQGSQYIVYAHRDPATGRLNTGICTRTSRLSEASEDLEYLRGPARTPSSLGTIRGNAVQLDLSPDGGQTRTSFAGARVIANGGGRTYETTTDGSGRYELKVPVGRYELRAEVPPSQYAWMLPKLEVIDARGCVASDVHVRWDGRISGRLLNARGEPVPFLPVELVRSRDLASSYSSPAEAVRTDSEGRYEFARIEPGTFHVGVNTRRRNDALLIAPRVLLERPGRSPLPIELGKGQRIAIADLMLPEAVQPLTLSGVVLGADGSPAAGAQVYVKLDTREFNLLLPAVTTNEDGRFTLTVIGGYRYRLNAELHFDGGFSSSGDSPVIDTTGEIGSITLRIRPSK